MLALRVLQLSARVGVPRSLRFFRKGREPVLRFVVLCALHTIAIFNFPLSFRAQRDRPRMRMILRSRETCFPLTPVTTEVGKWDCLDCWKRRRPVGIRRFRLLKPANAVISEHAPEPA